MIFSSAALSPPLPFGIRLLIRLMFKCHRFSVLKHKRNALCFQITSELLQISPHDEHPCLKLTVCLIQHPYRSLTHQQVPILGTPKKNNPTLIQRRIIFSTKKLNRSITLLLLNSYFFFALTATFFFAGAFLTTFFTTFLAGAFFTTFFFTTFLTATVTSFFSS